VLLEMVFATALIGQNSTTTCEPNAAGQVVCQTRERTRDTGARCAGGDWLLAGCTIGEHRAAREARAAETQATTSRERVIALLRSGDCAGATSAALDTGDIRLAADVRAFCSAQ
jgi:hypothetical protein